MREPHVNVHTSLFPIVIVCSITTGKSDNVRMTEKLEREIRDKCKMRRSRVRRKNVQRIYIYI